MSSIEGAAPAKMRCVQKGARKRKKVERGVLPDGVDERLVREHGHDLVLVADILGHADVKTTRAYARSQLEDRRAALEALAED